jgi:hypothetical protein
MERQLISYIAPAAPATRRPGRGDEPFLRPEIGFTVRWYREATGLDFGKQWHTDPAYRREARIAMARVLKQRFPKLPIGWVEEREECPDLLTGVFGGCLVAAIYGAPIVYSSDNWPSTAHQYLTAEQADQLEPPDLDRNPVFQELMCQVDAIARMCGRVEGFANWQGVLNSAYRIRGEDIFSDMAQSPERARRVFECVAATMTDGMRRLYARQRETGVVVRHCTVSNCLVNMVSPRLYRELLLPFDQELSRTFGLIGVHNCAWNADGYLDDYASVPDVAYIDMGISSDLARAKKLFPNARRAVMYTPMDVQNKPLAAIRADLERIAADFGPCDVVLADIEATTPDDRVSAVAGMCGEIGEKHRGSS